MKLTYLNPGPDHSICSILAFQTEEESAYWSEPLYHFYNEQIDRSYAESLPYTERTKYLADCIRQIYQQKESILNEKIDLYNAHWVKYADQITEALTDAFGIDCKNSFNDMIGMITLNPICPRFLDSRSFDVFYLNSERGALGMAIHEIIHFVWFAVWQQHFMDDPKEYERPHLKWILSEMVVESIMRDERLSSINPYTDGCVYDYFYTLKINGQPILDQLYVMYTELGIHAFMEESYRFCQKHEREIRAHIIQAES